MCVGRSDVTFDETTDPVKISTSIEVVLFLLPYQLTRKFLLRADSIKKVSFERAQKTEYDDQIFTEGYFQVPSKNL
jgi:hypothetical protein